MTLGAYSSQTTGATSSKFFTELAPIFLNILRIKLRPHLIFFNWPILGFMWKMMIFGVNLDFGSLLVLNYWGYKLQILYRTSPFIYQHSKNKIETIFQLDSHKIMILWFWLFLDFLKHYRLAMRLFGPKSLIPDI